MATESVGLDGLTVQVPDGVSVTSRSDAAYYLIRDLVVTLDLPPGAPISEPDLMARLKLGRTPVREALRRLARDRLVLVWPRRGMVVAPVDARDLAGIAEVRVGLEVQAARLAADRADDGDRAAARELIAAFGEVADDPRALIVLDQRVHRLVYRAAHNPFLAATLEEYLVLSLRLWFLGLERVSRLDEAVGEHRDLLEAVLGGDPDAAARIMHDHIRRFQRNIAHVLAAP